MSGPSTAFRRAFDWTFRDRRTGAVVIAQAPNPPLWIFLATVGLRLLLADDGTAHDVAGWIGRGALGWWAGLELVAGVNPWRRLLGVVGTALVVAGVAVRLA